MSGNMAFNMASKPSVDGGGFTPGIISNLQLWLDAADERTIQDTAGSVSQWDDKSGNGDNATQGTGTNQPTINVTTQNGLRTLDFDGINDRLAFPNLSLNGLTDVTVFAVFNVDSTTSGSDDPLSFGSGSEGQILMGASATAQSFALGFFSDLTPIAFGVEDSMNILGIVTSASASRSFKNGTLVAEDLTPPSAWTTGAGDYGVMASNTPNRHCKGQFAELIIYNKTLSDAERIQVETYLSNKWLGFQIPTDIGNCQLWLDAADASTITESGGSVSQWDDKSVKGNNVTQGTGAAQPTTNATTQNALNVLDFDGGDSLAMPSALFTIPAGDHTVFAVSARASEDASFDTIWGMAAGANNGTFAIYNSVAGQIAFKSRTTAGGSIVNAGNTNTDFNVIQTRRNGTTQAIAINGGTEATDANAENLAAVDGAFVGAAGTDTLNLTGNIAELIIYDRSLTADERTTVNNYLINKWGI